ncbi:MAG: Holliday junction branch migration protein RuvA [Actinomycetaceae bacterium]|nr:Holliday junction branch migration protein RuvA [Actinomycetaceae bacterium]
MIAQLRGSVVSRSLETVLIDVCGVGYEVKATPDTLARCHEGEETTLVTRLIIREDAHILFGFASTDERDVFDVLINAPGVGPKVAMAILSMLTPDELRLALADENEAALVAVPGIGKKTARQLIASIGDKLGQPQQAATCSPVVSTQVVHDDIVKALESLGWNTKQAQQAVAQAESDMPEANRSELLRAALQVLGAHHG